MSDCGTDLKNLSGKLWICPNCFDVELIHEVDGSYPLRFKLGPAADILEALRKNLEKKKRKVRK